MCDDVIVFGICVCEVDLIVDVVYVCLCSHVLF